MLYPHINDDDIFRDSAGSAVVTKSHLVSQLKMIRR